MLYLNRLNVSDINGYSYCVDMLRLKTEISIQDFNNKIESRFGLYADKIERWTSSKIGDFYYNFRYSNGDYSFWFGFISNKNANCLQNDKIKTRNLTIEFNPNKCKNDKFLLNILKCSNLWVLKSCDFAMDVPCNILDVCGFNKQGKDFLQIIDNGYDDRTYYMGKRNNRVKVYNKRIESNLDYDLTRIEITKYLDLDINLDALKSFDFGYFPKLFLKECQLDFNDLAQDQTLLAIVYAVDHDYPVHNLSRRYKDRVEAYYEQKKSTIKADFSCFVECLLNYIDFYFDLKSSNNI